jgi:hypothetical protein
MAAKDEAAGSPDRGGLRWHWVQRGEPIQRSLSAGSWLLLPLLGVLEDGPGSLWHYRN